METKSMIFKKGVIVSVDSQLHNLKIAGKMS